MNTLPFSVSLVIPLFNNANTLKPQLDKCNKLLKIICKDYEIIVCNDASTDSSSSLLQKYFKKRKFFQVYSHPTNQGISTTILELYKKASKDYIVLFSVDGDWNPKDIKKMLSKARQNKADIVIGKRNKQDYTFYRKAISFFYNFLPKILFGVDTYDAGSIKAFKKDVFQRTKIISTSLFFEAEFIIKAKKNGSKIIYCDVTYSKIHKTSGTAGKLSNVLHCLYDVVKVRLNF